MDQSSKDANDSNSPESSSSRGGQRQERRGNQELDERPLLPHHNDRHPYPPWPHELCPRLQHPLPLPDSQANGHRPSKLASSQWQYFMRHQPFGESGRHYQFPPPPRFPQQFQFGTFPGRSSTRYRQWRESMNHRTSASNSNDEIHSQQACKDARPKTGPFLNGKKKIHKKKGSHRNRKCDLECVTNADLPSCDVGLSNGVNREGKATREGKAKRRVKASQSCDERLLNEMATGTCSLVPECSPSLEEGAVGGVVASADLTTRSDECNGGGQFDKDLIDEGAVFDLDNVFKNHETSRLRGLSRSDSESEDNLDYVFDFEESKRDETALSSDNSESENGAYGGGIVSSHVYKSSFHQWNGLGLGPCGGKHEEGRSRVGNGIGVAGVTVNSVHDRNIVNNLIDSDNGEDTGDFIDTDLPLHTKHILSSSDEMDNLSSARESDEEDSIDKFQSISKKKCQSDVNCNDLSTLEPNILDRINSLDMREGEYKKTCGPVFSNLPDWSSRSLHSNCDTNIKGERSMEDSRHYSATSHVFGSDVASSSQFCSPQLCDSSHASHGAAVDLPLCGKSSSSCSANHLGADSELSSPLECFHHSSCATETISSTTKQDLCMRLPGLDHPALVASGQHCCPRAESPSQSSASGTSTAEERGGCCSNKLDHHAVNDLDSWCHRNHRHVANGFNDQQSSPDFTDDENNSQPKFSAGGSCEEKTAPSSSSPVNPCMGRKDVIGEASSSSLSEKSTRTLPVEGEGEEGSMFESSPDQVDMVLLPMEEEIEPVHAMEGPSGLEMAGVDFEDKYFFPNNPSLPSPINSINQSLENPPLSNEDHHHHYVREQHVYCRNRLPSKEFYELIKRVSTTESFMRFFDKDGQDVQRSTQKLCNEDDTNGDKGRQGGKSPGSKGDGLKVDRVMIWNEYEAYVVQFKQIAVSACGQTAVLNVLKALKFQCEKSVVCKVIKTNLRREDKDIPEYLFSRACAGTTAAELMQGMEKLTGGVIGGRFFHFWPPRRVKLLQWLAYWMKRGAIPLATLNLQQGPHSVWEVPDSWHHQMVYGVSHQGLYLTNPLEIVSERSAVKQLHSDSVLLVRRQDIVSRFRESTDLGQLVDHPDPRWMSMNVLGQVVNVLRECNMPSVPGYRLQVTSHVRIPASYQAGVTLFMRKDKSAWRSLVTAPELPLDGTVV